MGSEDEQRIGEELMEQMQTLGFCLITGVPGFDEDVLLDAIKRFHALPQDTKMQMALKHFNGRNKNIYHGYFPFLDSDPSHKEFYDMGRPIGDISDWEAKGCPLYEPNPWFEGSTEEQDAILSTFEANFKIMHSVALKTLRSLSSSLGKSSNYFDPWFKDECSSEFRAIHYKPREAGKGHTLSQDEHRLVTPPHTDSGFVTLLSTFMYKGLQVEIDGKYRSIQPVKNALVMNIGDTLERISGHKIRATRH